MVGRQLRFEGLETRSFELFAFKAGEERGEELQIFEGMLGRVKDSCGLLA